MNKKGIFLERLDSLIGEKFGNYSKYIIQERALPDLRDGLKPVQRRVLYAMNIIKLSHNSAYKKSARVVGDVIGKYHPHGDSSVYEAMVRLGQEWKLNLLLVDMHGNKGSVDGDSPAAMRYTETRLGSISEHLLSGLEKNLVNFSPNFDDSEIEPTVLPAKYPNLLVNGSTGIASGYSTNIPPHNFLEVIRSLIYVLKNDSVTLSNITKYIKGPDFPTGGIINVKNIKEAYKTGKGKVLMRANNTYSEKDNAIIITEIPFEVNKADLVKKIDDLIREGKVPGVKEVRDDTDRKGLQVTILLKPEANLELINNYLYKSTDLQKNYNLNMVAIKDKKPEQLGLVDMIQSFASFQIEIFKREFKYEVNKLESRLEIVDGLIKVVDVIDEIIKLIRKSSTKSEAKESIVKKFNFTVRQAEAIVNLRLYRLTSTDINSLVSEKKELNKSLKHFSKGLKDKNYLVENIISNLEELMKKFPIKRKTKIVSVMEEIEISDKDLIKEEQVSVIISYQGYVKKVSLKSKELSEGKPGRRDDDIIITEFESSNMSKLILFSSTGKYYVTEIYKLKDNKWRDVGNHVSTFTGMNGLDRIIAVAVVDTFDFGGKLIISTSNGQIKQTEISNLSNKTSKRGAKYITLKGDDEVVSISKIDSEDYFVISITSSANALKYTANNVPTIGLTASGVRNINLPLNEKVVSTIIQPTNMVDKGELQLLLFTNTGKAKRIKSLDVKGLTRGSKGSVLVKQIKSNPFKIINLFSTENLDKINLLSTSNEYKIIKAKSEIILSEGGTGLSNIIDGGLLFAFNDLNLNLDTTKPKLKKTNSIPKYMQLDVDDILDTF